MKDLKHRLFSVPLKKFNQSSELNISDVIDGRFEMIGSNLDEIIDGINFINQNYDGSVKVNPMDWSLLVSDVYSIIVKFEPEGDENKHIRFMNDMLSENNFDCKLYKTK
jgi:hypothetical protein